MYKGVIIDYIRKNYAWICLALAAVFLVCFSVSELTSRPRTWIDEGLNIEAASNLLQFGKVNIQLSPGIFSETPVTLVTSGYPILVPVAAVFYFFGLGLFQARLFMVLILVAVLTAVFLFTRKLFGDKEATCAVLLTASFAPFYANGITVTGDLPGFLFLIIGLYFLVIRRSYALVGVFFGLAAVSKPSLYLLLLPATYIFFIITRSNFLSRSTQFTVGLFLPMVIHVLLIIPDALSSTAGWLTALKIYQNPYIGAPSLLQNVFENIKSIPSQPTLAYFLLLAAGIGAAVFVTRRSSEEQRPVVIFYLVYSSLVVLYFLRSPGWFRYLLPAQLLTFIFIYYGVRVLVHKIREGMSIPLLGHSMICVLLVFFQVYVLFFRSHIFPSTKPLEVISFFKTHPAQSTGLINVSEVAAFIDPSVRYQLIDDIRQFGVNPFTLPQDKLLHYVLITDESSYLIQNAEILETHYQLIQQIGKYQIYELKQQL